MSLTGISGITPPSWGTVTAANPTVTTTHLQGKMIVAALSIPEYKLESMDSDQIKRMLLTNMVEELYNANLVEFTKQNSHAHGTVDFRARIYALPDTQVRVVRQMGNY